MSAIKKTKTKENQRRKTAKIIQLNIFSPLRQPGNKKLITGLWHIAKAALWNKEEFSEKETAQFKELLSEHFLNDQSAQFNFIELAQRICLVKRYLSRKKGRYVAKPIDWLNINFPMGLTGTSIWLSDVNEIRTKVPDYNKGISTLAKALLKFIESPDIKVFGRYKRILAKQKQYDLLQIFYNTIIHLQYSN